MWVLVKAMQAVAIALMLRLGVLPGICHALVSVVLCQPASAGIATVGLVRSTGQVMQHGTFMSISRGRFWGNVIHAQGHTKGLLNDEQTLC